MATPKSFPVIPATNGLANSWVVTQPDGGYDCPWLFVGPNALLRISTTADIDLCFSTQNTNFPSANTVNNGNWQPGLPRLSANTSEIFDSGENSYFLFNNNGTTGAFVTVTPLSRS